MIITKKEFEVIKPSKTLRKLSILSELGVNPRISQRKLAKLTSVTSTMVNNYLQELNDEQLITISGETNRSFEYHLTDKGIQEKARLLQEAWTELIQIYGIIKNELYYILQTYKNAGITRLSLYGAAETGELAYVACKTLGIEVVGVFDSEELKWGKLFMDKQIEPPARLSILTCKNILITSMGHAAEIKKAILRVRQDMNIMTLIGLRDET